MNGKPADLAQIQRWMQSVIMHPGGVTEGITSPQARQHIDLDPEDLAQVIAPSRSLDSAARLEIYVDAYYERLLECLREEFTATRTTVGEDLFNALAFGYLQHYPSRSYTLNLLGANLPRYLAESRLHEHDAPTDSGPNWADFVIELARFERTLRDVFDGPGSEGKPMLAASRLASIPLAAWGRVRLVAAPCLRLARFSHPVDPYWAALKRGEQPAVPGASPTCMAIHRRNYRVEPLELAPLEFELLGHLIAGARLDETLARLAESHAADLSEVENGLHDWFARWTQAGYFLDVS